MTKFNLSDEQKQEQLSMIKEDIKLTFRYRKMLEIRFYGLGNEATEDIERVYDDIEDILRILHQYYGIAVYQQEPMESEENMKEEIRMNS